MNNNDLADYLVNRGALRTSALIEAFKTVDRQDFVVKEHKNSPYGDFPLPIGFGQTISQPTTVAIMLELLQPKKGDKILDIGSGSGWTTALLAKIVGSQGRVVGIEKVPELVDFGSKNLKKYNFEHANIQKSDKTLGKPDMAPFDKVLVSAAAQEMPRELLEQVKIGGSIVIPIKHSVFRIEKTSENDFTQFEYPGFAFVPLIES